MIYEKWRATCRQCGRFFYINPEDYPLRSCASHKRVVNADVYLHFVATCISNAGVIEPDGTRYGKKGTLIWADSEKG